MHAANIGRDEWAAEQDSRPRPPAPWSQTRSSTLGPHRAVGLIAVTVALLPFLSGNDLLFRLAGLACLFAMLTLGLNVVVGYVGLLDLGYVAFFGVGGYAYALLSSDQLGIHLPAALSVPLAVVLCAALGLLLGLPALRLSGDHLAIVTLAFAQVFGLLVLNLDRIEIGALGQIDLTGGPNGIVGVDPLATVGARPPGLAESYLIWLIALGLVVLAISHLDRSPLGRAWRAIGEDPLAAASLGIPVNRLRLLALAVAAGVAGLGGAIFAASQLAVFPSSFDLGLLITLYGMLVLGGVGSLRGAVVGAVLLTLLPELLRDPWTASLLFYGCGAALGFGLLLRRRWRALALLTPGFILAAILWETRLAAEPSVTRLLFLGALLVVLMIYRPHGLFGRPRVEVL